MATAVSRVKQSLRSTAVDERTVILVEGHSDRVALETLAGRRGRDLAREGVEIVAIGGAHAIRNALQRFGDANVRGLCDAGEERHFMRAVVGAEVDRAELERRGFFVCDGDLEDELIRALGIAAVEDVLAANGDLDGFRAFQHQPAQRTRTHDAQLHRFFGTTSGRKAEYARLLVEALDLERVPYALDAVLGRTDH
jgi:hypothetical protein